jgi:hypothetical protein
VRAASDREFLFELKDWLEQDIKSQKWKNVEATLDAVNEHLEVYDEQETYDDSTADLDDDHSRRLGSWG